MKRQPLLMLAMGASLVIGGSIATVLVNDEGNEQSALAQTTCSTGLVRTNNSGNSPLSIPCIPNTPCWRQGNQTYRPADVTFSACTAPAPTTSTTLPTTSSTSTTSLPSTSTSTTSTSTSPQTSTTIPSTTTTSSTSTTVAPTTTSTTTLPPATTTTTMPPPPGAQFVETFDNNTGRDRFTWGVYHADLAHQQIGGPLPSDMDNNQNVSGTWSADHDLACGGVETQRTLRSDFQQDTTGANGWRPIVNFHLDELFYVCRDHVMTSMGDPNAAFTVLWFAPNQAFADVNSVEFDVNLTNLGGRKWWKVGVVSDALYNSTYLSAANVRVPGHVVSDVGSSRLNTSLQGPDRLIATFSGTASAGTGCIKIGNPQTGVCPGANNDKMTRYPVSLRDNHNGTVTFTVNEVSVTRAGAFPACPCRVIFYDQNYTPTKDGPIQGTTWHWDSVVVR